MGENHSNRSKERELISNFLSGGALGARTFFEEYGGIIKHVALSIGLKSNAADADDLFMDAVEYLLKDDKKAVRYFKGKSRFSTYLYVICRRFVISKAVKESRATKRMINVEPDLLPSQFFEESEVWDDEKREALNAAIKTLKKDSQLFIRMMFYDKRPTAEIMKVFELNSENSVYSRKNKLITKIKKVAGKILKEKGLQHV